MRLKVFRIVPCLGNNLILKEFDSSKLQIMSFGKHICKFYMSDLVLLLVFISLLLLFFT